MTKTQEREGPTVTGESFPRLTYYGIEGSFKSQNWHQSALNNTSEQVYIQYSVVFGFDFTLKLGSGLQCFFLYIFF